MTPSDALHLAIFTGFAYERKGPLFNRPGAIIERMRGEAREALQALTSAETMAMRAEPEELMDRAYSQRLSLSLMLQEFDRKLH